MYFRFHSVARHIYSQKVSKWYPHVCSEQVCDIACRFHPLRRMRDVEEWVTDLAGLKSALWRTDTLVATAIKLSQVDASEVRLTRANANATTARNNEI